MMEEGRLPFRRQCTAERQSFRFKIGLLPDAGFPLVCGRGFELLQEVDHSWVVIELLEVFLNQPINSRQAFSEELLDTFQLINDAS